MVFHQFFWLPFLQLRVPLINFERKIFFFNQKSQEENLVGECFLIYVWISGLVCRSLPWDYIIPPLNDLNISIHAYKHKFNQLKMNK